MITQPDPMKIAYAPLEGITIAVVLMIAGAIVKSGIRKWKQQKRNELQKQQSSEENRNSPTDKREPNSPPTKKPRRQWERKVLIF